MSRLQSAAGRVPGGWSFSQWPLRRKLASALVLPVALAAILGGLRISSEFDQAREFSAAADASKVVEPLVAFNSAVQTLATSAVKGGPARNPSVVAYEKAAADLSAAAKSNAISDKARSEVNSALASGKGVRNAVGQDGAMSVVIDKAAATAVATSAVVGDLGLTNDASTAKSIVGIQDVIAAHRSMTTQQLSLDNPDDGGAIIASIGQVGAEASFLTRLKTEVLPSNASDLQRLTYDNFRRGVTLQGTGGGVLDRAFLADSYRTSGKAYAAVVQREMLGLEGALTSRASNHRTSALVNTALVTLALLATLVLVLALIRSLLTPIRMVRSGALEIANKRLPEAVAAMRDGEEPPAFVKIPVTTTEEMGQLARAVDDLHSQALSLAGDQARLRVQVGHMFETLSRRSTSLIDQQLGLIERLESDEEDPKRLQSLFRLDHLAARMRRNSDSLLVLAGTSTRRGISGSVSVSDAVRAAVSEVEQYERIDIGDTSNDQVLGAVGSDLIHLVAEVVDNALAYSPPTSRVGIRGARTPEGGLLIEVADRGLGMPPKELAALNDRLANGGDITADTARRMGLFVVGSLAKRHGIAVRLRRNGDDKQGITVSVHLPAGLLADSARTDRPAARPAAALDTVAAPVVPVVPATPPTSSVGGTTKSGLPTRVRGASGATPSPVPGAAKALPSRTPGAHGPGAPSALPAAAKPVIDGADSASAADTKVPNGTAAHDRTATNGKAATNGTAAKPAAEAPATAATPDAVDAAAKSGDEAASDTSGDTASRSAAGLPVRKPRATGITEARDLEFQEVPAKDARPSAAPVPVKGSRLTSWLPGRKAAAEAARAEAEAEAEPRQMPSNLSAWLDHRTKLVEAAKARELGETAPAEEVADSLESTTQMHVPDEWVSEASTAAPAPVVDEAPTQVMPPVEPVALAPVEPAPAEPVEPTAPVFEATAPEAPDQPGALPTRVPGATSASAAALTEPGAPTGRPALRAHNTSFFGARKARGSAPADPGAPSPSPAPQAAAPAPTLPVSQPPAPVEPVRPPVAAVAPVEPRPHVEESSDEPTAPLDDTPIFRAMMSRWLTDDTQPGTSASGWSSSEADQAWSAAARIEETEPLEESSAGLPKRRPGKNLIPGAIDHAPDDQPVATPTGRRDPESIRRSLNRHKNGVSSARTDTQDGTHREEADVHH